MSEATLPVAGVLVKVNLPGSPYIKRLCAQYVVSAPLGRSRRGADPITSPKAWARKVVTGMAGVKPDTAEWDDRITPKVEVLRASWALADEIRPSWLTADYLMDAMLDKDCTGQTIRIATEDEAPAGVVLKALDAITAHPWDYREGCDICDLVLLGRGSEALKLLRVDDRAVFDLYRAFLATRVVREIEYPAPPDPIF